MDHEDREALLEKNLDGAYDRDYDAGWRRWQLALLLYVRNYVLVPSKQLNPRFIQSRARSLVRRFLYACVPQVFRTRFFNDPLPAAGQIHSTSWMNGLRGIAALTVFNWHFISFYTETTLVGFGTTSQDKWIHQLPIIVLFCDGMLSVDIFFVIGGYVCSQKAIQLMTNGDKVGVFKSLPASVFRRFFRLYLPVMCSTLCISLLAYLGAYEPTRFLMGHHRHEWFAGTAGEYHPAQYSTIAGQLGKWWSVFKGLMNFWQENHPMPELDLHLWTIHHEFRASMHLYIALMGTALCKSWARIGIFMVLSYVYVGLYGHWVEVAYFSGAILAQVDILRARKQKERLLSADTPNDHEAHMNGSNRTQRRVRALLRPLCYLFALVLLSYPKHAASQPMPFWEQIVTPWIPSYYNPGRAPHFAKETGIIILLSLIASVPIQQRAKSLWHRCLTASIPQYLGRIMFGLYLVHGMCLHLGGYMIPQLVWRQFSAANKGEFGEKEDMGMGIFLTGLLVGWSITLAITLAVADVWTREVEGRCTKVTHWLEGVLFVDG